MMKSMETQAKKTLTHIGGEAYAIREMEAINASTKADASIEKA